MKRFLAVRSVVLVSVVLVAVLSACRQSPETAVPSDISLDTASLGGLPIFTDDVGLAKTFGELGSDVELLEPGELFEAAHAKGAGAISYTPSGEILPWWWIPDLELWPPLCDPRWCDPVPFLEIGWRFEGFYATENFVQKAEKIGLSSAEISSLSIGKLQGLVEDYGLDVGSVGYILPDDWDSPCFNRNPPRWCLVANGGLVDDPFDADILVLDSRDLLDVHRELGHLVQIHGEGLEPEIYTAKASVSPKLSEKEAGQFGEFLTSPEAQASLYTSAGLIPASVDVQAEVVDKGVREYVEGAMKYGARPTPVPVD